MDDSAQGEDFLLPPLLVVVPRFECPGKSPSEPLHGAGVRLQNSPGHARRSVYGLGPAVHRPAGSSHPRESPVLMAQPPRYSSPAAPRDMSPGHRRERRFKRPQRYRRLRRRPQYLPRSLPESGDRARWTPRPSRPRALQRSVAISATCLGVLWSACAAESQCIAPHARIDIYTS